MHIYNHLQYHSHIQWMPLNRETDNREIRLIGTHFLEQIHIYQLKLHRIIGTIGYTGQNPDSRGVPIKRLPLYLLLISIHVVLAPTMGQYNMNHIQSVTKLFTIFLFYNICYFKSNSLSRWILLLYSCNNIHWRLELFLMKTSEFHCISKFELQLGNCEK